MRLRLMALWGSLLLLFWLLWLDLSPEIAKLATGRANVDDLARAGQWGDSFGPFNALISTGAFAVITATLIVQHKSIREQAADLHRQRFESTFFELMRLLRQLRDEFVFKYSKEYRDAKAVGGSLTSRTRLSASRSGVEAFRTANVEMVFWLIQGGIAGSPSKEQLVNIYMRRVHSKEEARLAPYFRLIYTILKNIYTDSVLSNEEKARYSNLIRSQLTSHEIVLLGVNGLAPISADLADFLRYSRAFKYLPRNAWRRRLEGAYPAVAFMGRD